jgi:hypothetical protein
MRVGGGTGIEALGMDFRRGNYLCDRRVCGVKLPH